VACAPDASNRNVAKVANTANATDAVDAMDARDAASQAAVARPPDKARRAVSGCMAGRRIE